MKKKVIIPDTDWILTVSEKERNENKLKPATFRQALKALNKQGALILRNLFDMDFLDELAEEWNATYGKLNFNELSKVV